MSPESQLILFISGFEILKYLCFYIFNATEDSYNTVAAALHSVFVIFGSITFFYTNDLDIQRIVCIFSTAYMLWDVRSLYLIKYKYFTAMMFHHWFAIVCLFSVAKFQPRGLKYCALLLLTEATVPMNSIRSFLEKNGYTNSILYTINRWLLLITWIFFRLYLFIYFFRWSSEEWSTMTSDMMVMYGIGPFLLLFNVAGLFKMVLVGFPWFPKSDKKVS